MGKGCLCGMAQNDSFELESGSNAILLLQLLQVMQGLSAPKPW